MALATSLLAVAAAPLVARAQPGADDKAHGAPPLCGVLVLPRSGVDVATARQLSKALLAAFARERELTLIDARRLARSQRLEPRFPPPAKVAAIEAMLRARRLFRARHALRLLLRQMRGRLADVRKRTLAKLSAALALINWRLGAKRRAQQQLEALLVWRPSYPLESGVSAAGSSPTSTTAAGWIKLVKAARAAVRARPRGSVRITSLPPGAATFLDGRRLGPTPTLAANVVAGEHLVTVRLSGHVRVVLPVSVPGAARATPTFSVRLERDPAGSPLAPLTRHLADSLGINDLAEARAIGERLSIGLGLFVTATPAAGGKLALAAHLYDLNSGHRKASATLTVPQPFSAAHLAPIAVWRAAGGPITTSPKKSARPARSTPIYKRWWFWAAIAGVAAAGVVVPVVLTRGESEQPPGEVLRVSW